MGAVLGIATLATEVDLEGLDSGLDEGRGKTEGWLSSLGGKTTALLGGIVAGGALLAAGAVVGIGAAAFGVASDMQAATNTIQTQLGLTADEAAELGDIAGDVWANNFGADITEAAGVVATIRQQVGGLADDELQRATENAFRLSDAFGIDTAESVSTVKTLMDEFGLTSDEAFDFITTGFQQGLNRSDDFIDSIGEYSNLFSDAGFDAGEFFSIMETGAEGGVLGTDKVADAIKEMGIILAEGGDGVSAAFDQIGLDFDEVAGFVAAGDEDWADYFPNIIEGINSIEDPLLRQQTQVAIFGTMAEDLGVSFTEGLSKATTALEDMSGATGTLDAQYNTLPQVIEGFKRQFLISLEPVGAVLLDLANYIMPLVQQGFAWFETTLVPIIEDVANKIGLFVSTFATIMGNGGTAANAFAGALATIGVPNETINQIMGLVGGVQEFIATIQEFVTQHAEEIKGALIAIGAVLAGAAIASTIAGVVAAVAALANPVGLIVLAVGLLGAAWAGNWGGIRDILTAFWFETAQPILQNVWAWLSVNVPLALEALRAFWVDVAWPAIVGAAVWFQENVVPILQNIWNWLSVNVPAALETLRTFWVDTAWPAIQTAIATVWPIIQTIFTSIRDWVVNILVPTVRDLYQKWVEVWWPQIQTALENAWTIIEEIFGEIGRWVNDNIVPWIEFLHERWAEEVWPDIQKALQDVWNIIEPIWIALVEWLEVNIPRALEALQPIFEGVMSGINAAVEPVKTLWDGFVGAVQEFWSWLTSHDFSFDISLPDLPEWAIPGSPLPLHTAWEDFGDYLREEKFEPRLGFALASSLTSQDGKQGATYRRDSQSFTNYGGIIMQGVEDMPGLLERLQSY